LPYSAGDETPFIDVKNALKLNLIEKYIELGELVAAQERIEKLVNECIENNCTLNLAGRTILANSQLWQGIIFRKDVICLDADQIKSLSMEQQQQYHTLFFETVKSGDLEQVKQGMQKFSWQVNIKNEAGYTPIITACWYGYEDIAKHLFAQGGDIVKIERFGEIVNPLDGLVRNRYKEEPDRYKSIIVWLVENDLELTPNNALSLKDRDLFLNSLKILEYDIQRKDKLKSLLITAIEEGEDIVVRAIAEHQTECLKSFPKEKHKKKFFSFLEDSTTRKKDLPLLHRACEAAHFQVVNTLLCLDEDLSADSKANKRAALIYLTEVFNQKYPAVDKDLYERWRLIAQLLCGQGAQHTLYSWLIFHDNIEEAPQYLNQKNIHLPCDAMGNTPLHIAIRTRNLILADWLIKEKAVLEVVNSNKELPLYIACCQGDAALVKLLLEAGASVDGPRRELTEAERKQLTDLSATFIEMQDFLSRKPLCLEKKTPLQQAVYCKKNEVVELLCLHGANVKENYNGETPLHLAIENKDVKSVQILLRYGANSLAPHHQKESALRAAVTIKHIPIIILLVDSYLNQYPDGINKDETIKWIATELGAGEIRQRFYDALIAWANDFGKEGSIQPTSVIQTAPRLPEATTSALTSSSSSLFSPMRYRNIAPHHQIVYHLSTNFYDEEGKDSIILDSIGSDYEDQPELLPPEPMFYDPPSPQKRG
jgi:ankyrin repeat protein